MQKIAADVRVRGGDDVSSNSHLVMATLKLKLRRNGPGKDSLYTDHRSLPGTQTEEEEGVDHSRYLASHGEQLSSEEESQRHQMREGEREMLAAAPRSTPDR